MLFVINIRLNPRHRVSINDSFVLKRLYFQKYHTYTHERYMKITTNSPSLYCVFQVAALASGGSTSSVSFRSGVAVRGLYLSKMEGKQEKSFCVLEYARCSSVIAVQRAFRREYGKEPQCKQSILR